MRSVVVYSSILLGLYLPLTASATTTVPTAMVSVGGHYHTLALKSDGTVVAWGFNTHGELGINTQTSSPSPVNVPMTGLIGVVAGVSAGYYHSVALISNGTVMTWGSNTHGELGNGLSTYSLIPTQVLTGVTNNVTGADGKVTAVAEVFSGADAVIAGAGHTLAHKADGTVWAWGLNDTGQLGNNTLTDSVTPVLVQGLTDVTAVTAGNSHNMALKADGTVWAWGSDYLGNGTTNKSLIPVLVPGLTNVKTISTGYLHTVALKYDGAVVTWGDNSAGKLGDGSTTNRLRPVSVSGLSGVKVKAVAAGYNHTVALAEDGKVWTWGDNSYGQLGDGSTTNRSLPVQVPGLDSVVSVAAGFGDTLAVKADGSVVSWGYNAKGELGDGTTVTRLRPVAVSGGLNLNVSTPSAFNDDVFAYAEANFSTLFPGTDTNKQFEQYTYRSYSNGNNLGIDTSGIIYILGPLSNGIAPVGNVAGYTGTILTWKANKPK